MPDSKKSQINKHRNQLYDCVYKYQTSDDKKRSKEEIINFGKLYCMNRGKESRTMPTDIKLKNISHVSKHGDLIPIAVFKDTISPQTYNLMVGNHEIGITPANFKTKIWGNSIISLITQILYAQNMRQSGVAVQAVLRTLPPSHLATSVRSVLNVDSTIVHLLFHNVSLFERPDPPLMKNTLYDKSLISKDYISDIKARKAILRSRKKPKAKKSLKPDNLIVKMKVDQHKPQGSSKPNGNLNSRKTRQDTPKSRQQGSRSRGKKQSRR
jgi:hypothetical protein